MGVKLHLPTHLLQREGILKMSQKVDLDNLHSKKRRIDWASFISFNASKKVVLVSGEET